MKLRDPINRYLRATRLNARALTMRAAQEAAHFLATGQHQEIRGFFYEKDDERETRNRLTQYQQWLMAARRAGRYRGGTELRRVLASGRTEPLWCEPRSFFDLSFQAPIEPVQVPALPTGAQPSPRPAPQGQQGGVLWRLMRAVVAWLWQPPVA
jgi:hypothetical protein